MPKRRIEPAPPQRPVADWRRGTVAAVTTLLAGVAILCTGPLFMLAFTGTTSSVTRSLIGEPPPAAPQPYDSSSMAMPQIGVYLDLPA